MRLLRLARTVVPLLGLASAACAKNEPAASSADAGTAADAEPVAKSVPANDAGLNPMPPSAMQSIPERFASESTHRPTSVPRVEDVMAAFEKEGAKLRESKQHLGAPFLAKYCVGTKTGEDVHLSICEYDDAKRAAAGLKESETAFAAVANRTLYQNGGTTLTMRLGANGPADQALAKKLVEAFKAVKPAAAAPKTP